MTLLDELIKRIRKAAEYNPSSQAAPACILWTDKERRFEPVIQQIQARMPELLVAGDYAPEKRRGPAIWIRCALAGELPDHYTPGEKTPVVYMPGISRSEMRQIEEHAIKTPNEISPLIYYQFRGTFFTQRSNKDWTILAFLSTKDSGGMGFETATDGASVDMMRKVFPKLLDCEADSLKGKRLDCNFYISLIIPDPIKSVLEWLNGGTEYLSALDAITKEAFAKYIKTTFGIDIDEEEAAVNCALKKFADRSGTWETVFCRYGESWEFYPEIPKRLRNLNWKPGDLFNDSSENGWPQWNDGQENSLSKDLNKLTELSPQDAREKIAVLEAEHKGRRDSVWAKMGEAPLATALEHLADLANLTTLPLPNGSFEDYQRWYLEHGRLVDLAAWKAFAAIDGKNQESATIKDTILLFYRTWLEQLNCKFQSFFEKGEPYPWSPRQPEPDDDDTAYFFIDGMRADIALELTRILERKEGITVSESYRWGPIPTITACGKPGAIPAKPALDVTGDDMGFDPRKALPSPRDLLKEFRNRCKGDGNSWSELEHEGIDQAGHTYKEDAPRYFQQLLENAAASIISKLEHFGKVKVVTDHGWLWLPENLEQQNLPTDLVEEKSGRYARMKEGIAPEGISTVWSWNSMIPLVVPEGIRSYRKGVCYAHGGISLQECCLAELTVSGNKKISRKIEIAELGWKRLRCHYRLDGDIKGCTVDIRPNAGKDESFASKPGTVKPDGTGSVLVKDDALEGNAAFLVVLAPEGIVATKKVEIGK